MSKSTQCVSGNVGIQDEWSVFTVLALNQHPTWATTSHSVCVLPGEPEPCGSPGRNWNWLSSFSYTVSGSWSGLNQSELLFTSSCSRTGTRTQATKDESSHDALTPHTRVHKHDHGGRLHRLSLASCLPAILQVGGLPLHSAHTTLNLLWNTAERKEREGLARAPVLCLGIESSG